MSVIAGVLPPPLCSLISQVPLRLLAPDAFLPHCPPALALHCALLI